MSFSEWRLIISEALPGAVNMAFDEVLFDAVSREESPPVLRFYQWEKPTVSIGYGQDVDASLNLDFCRQRGLPIVRRITGGRAVIHDCELTYAVISPEKNALFPGNIQGNYAIVSGCLKEAIEEFGIAVEMAPGRRGRASSGMRDFRYNACFNSPSIHELVVDGRKITGSAQMRRQGFFLQHGSIPVEMDLRLAVQALTPGHIKSFKNGEELLSRKVGWLNRFSSQPVYIPMLREKIITAFCRRLGKPFFLDDFSSLELERAEVMRESKYDHPTWTLNRKIKTA